MPASDPTQRLSRRERQIMDVIYRRGRATAAEVQRELPDPPGYSAVRSALSLLEERGLLRHEEEGRRYVYLPATPPRKACVRALDHLLRVFFGGSRARAGSGSRTSAARHGPGVASWGWTRAPVPSHIDTPPPRSPATMRLSARWTPAALLLAFLAAPLPAVAQSSVPGSVVLVAGWEPSRPHAPPQ